jgi:signal transduction histidine kinase
VTVRDTASRHRLLADLLRLALSSEPLDAVLRAFSAGVTAPGEADALAVARIDRGRGQFTALATGGHDLDLGTGPGGPHPVAGTLLARLTRDGAPVLVDDLAGTADAGSAPLVAAGYRSALVTPLVARDAVVGAVVLASRRARAFDAEDAAALGALGQALAAAFEQRRLLEEARRHVEELGALAATSRALFEAGRAVTASLDVRETIRVIMEAARSVLGVDSCSIARIDAARDELVTVASLDLPPEMVSRIRLRVGEGIAGLAVRERRPIQSADIADDPRVRYPQVSQASGFRSMLAAPLRIGDHVIGAISVLRRQARRFSPDEEQLLVALADQAAIALEHARLYTQLEGMVADRTHELDTQKRFVEVVLEALPLGVFVLDRELGVVRVNREGARLLGGDTARGGGIGALLPPERAGQVEAFLRGAFGVGGMSRTEEELVIGGETRVFRLTAARIEPDSDHLVLLVEDVTLAKRLERQVLLTERLTIAGRLAAGVAHELNNPLATIAGCAEALRGRLDEPGLARLPGAEDFRHYLGLIEEEAYRCKDITGSLLGFVREPGSRRAPTDLNALVVKTVELLSHQSRFAGERFATELDPGLPPVTINEGQMRQVFLGLATNALDAMGAEGTLHLRTRGVPEEVEVEFEDEGPGIPEEVLVRIFDPFFTTKPPGQGTGLGLAIAQSIVTDHGGRIDVTSRMGKGSIFRVVLPR